MTEKYMDMGRYVMFVFWLTGDWNDNNCLACLIADIIRYHNNRTYSVLL